MRPVVDRGQAAIDRFGKTQPHAARIVFGGEHRAEDTAIRKIAGFLVIARHVARRRAPHMPMRFDEARHCDHGLAVDDLRVRRIERAADRDDRTVAYMEIAARQIADRRIHRQHISAADHELAALRQRARRRRCRGRRRRRGGREPAAEYARADGCPGHQQPPTREFRDIETHGVPSLKGGVPAAVCGLSRYICAAGREVHFGSHAATFGHAPRSYLMRGKFESVQATLRSAAVNALPKR